MAGCPGCTSPLLRLRIRASLVDGWCSSCGATWVEYGNGFVVVGRGPCPCCKGALVDHPGSMPARFADARPGDRYCPECDALILRERSGDRADLRCPTHKRAASVPGDGPGASHRWVAASLVYGRSRRAFLHAERRTSEVRSFGRTVRGEVRARRRAQLAA